MLPRGWITDTAALYGRVFRRGARLALTNWPVGLMVVAYGALLGLVASVVLAPFRFLAIVFGLAVLVFFNAVPELTYLGRHSAAELLVESYRFIGENWIEWFPATLALGAAVVAVAALPGGPFGIVGDAGAGVLLYFMMIVRGLLFLELASSSRRAREFRRRMAG